MNGIRQFGTQSECAFTDARLQRRVLQKLFISRPKDSIARVWQTKVGSELRRCGFAIDCRSLRLLLAT